MVRQGRRGSIRAMIIRNVRSLSMSLKKNDPFFIGGVIRKMEILLKLKIEGNQDGIISQIKQQLEEIDNPIHLSEAELRAGGLCYELYAGDEYHVHVLVKKDEIVFIKEDMR